MWLLDTVTLSEMIKPNSQPQVIEWLENQDKKLFFTSVLCIGELRYGIERMPPGKKRDEYRAWLERIINVVLKSRIISFDPDIAKTWAETRVHVPRTLPMIDSLIAATALNQDLIVVTRNTKDFAAFGVTCFDPWEIAN